MSWTDPKRWEELQKGEGCQWCQDVFSPETADSFLVTELAASVVRMPKNQANRGWLIVVTKTHACEIFALPKDQRHHFIDDISKVAKAAQKIWEPVKINYAIYGNIVPHLHCHIQPRYRSEVPAPVDMNKVAEHMRRDDYTDKISRLQALLRDQKMIDF